MKTAAEFHMPPDALDKQILIAHKQYGWVLSWWDKFQGCYIGTGRAESFVHGSNSPFVMVQFRDEQLPLVQGWMYIHNGTQTE